MCHEIFGRTEYTGSLGAQLSAAGFWAAVLDLFRGRRATNLDEGRKYREEVTEAMLTDAYKNARALLGERIGAGAKIGALGMCMGGHFSLLGATKLGLDFCIDYYGGHGDEYNLQNLKGPLMLVLASEDESVNSWAFQKLLPAATKQKLRVDTFLYPNTKHAFHRPGWDGHDPVAAADSWQKTLAFLSQFR